VLRSTQKLVFVLALAAIALLAFSSTAELLPHHHDNINERVCPLCHPPLIGLQAASVRLPSLSNRSWAINISDYRGVFVTLVCNASPRAPPAA
jgi:hypothetical protein